MKRISQQELEEAFDWEEAYDVLYALESLIRDKYGEIEVDLEALPQSERAVVLINQLRDEVANGGFLQYFTNASGEYAIETLRILKVIGATDSARILEQALMVFPAGQPAKGQADRARQVEHAGRSARDMLDLLDEEFYRQQDNLLVLVRRHLEQHRIDFLASA
jgi:hypothetical protein